MTTIVIPDIHNHVKWIEPMLRFLKKKYNYDEVVFLGDYFDNFGDIPLNAQDTAIWLKQSLQHTDRIHLLGNHDMPYMVPGNASQGCPGYTSSKLRIINNTLMSDDWNKLSPAYYSQGFLMSHAGFNPNLITHPVLGIPTPEELVIKAEIGLQDVKNGNYHPLFLPGSRMGELNHGGITWQDWDDEFEPVEGINQLVGHTPSQFTVSQPKSNPLPSSQNWCLDRCGHNYFIGIIKDGEIAFTTKDKLEYERQVINIPEESPELTDSSGE